jgi:hypothetical protein
MSGIGVCCPLLIVHRFAHRFDWVALGRAPGMAVGERPWTRPFRVCRHCLGDGGDARLVVGEVEPLAQAGALALLQGGEDRVGAEERPRRVGEGDAEAARAAARRRPSGSR